MRCLFSRATVLAFLTTTLVPVWSQRVDPSRLGEAVRPLAVPGLLDPESPAALGLEDPNDFAPASPGDDDIGQQLILKDAARERWLSAQLDTFAYWTDNPANLSEGGKDDVFWGTQISLGAQPRLRNRLYADAAISQQIYRYDKFQVLDYEFFEASLGLIYVEPRLWNSILFVQGRYGHMTNDDFGQDVLNSFSIRAGIQKTVLFDRRNSLHLNLMGDWDLDTDVDQLDRSEYIADLSYSFKIMRDLILSASYRFTWFDYQKVDRGDALNLMGANLTWSPRKWLDVYVAGTFSINESNVNVFDYQAANVGGGVGVRIRF